MEDNFILVCVYFYNMFSDLFGFICGIYCLMILVDGMCKIVEEGGILVLLGKEEYIEY